MEQPKVFAQLEILILGAKNEYGVDRLSIPLEGESLKQMAAQLENITGGKLNYESETAKIWLHGNIAWESEEQRQEYLSKHKYIKLT